MLAQRQIDWNRGAVCASVHKRQSNYWTFTSQSRNRIRDAAISPGVDLYKVSLPKADHLAESFTKLSQEWQRQTGHLSSIERKAMHPTYQAIIGMGMQGVPYVLRELKNRSGHWFWALHYMTGCDLSKPNQTIEELRNEWLEWGRHQGYTGI